MTISVVEAEKRAAAGSPDPTALFQPGPTQHKAKTFPASAPSALQSDCEAGGAGEAKDRLAGYYESCPQGDDCAGDGKHRRLFDCEQGCGFRGCAACMEVHESEPHSSELETRREMYRNMGETG